MRLKGLISMAVCAALAAGTLPAGAAGEAKPSKKSVITAMRVANDYYMNKWSDPGQVIPYPSRKKNYEANLWTRGYYFEGLMDLYEVDPQQRYIDYAVEWGEKHNWGLRGTKNGVLPRNADNLCAGQTYIYLYQLDPKKPKKYIAAITAAIDTMMASDKIDDWSWIDAVQMAMPIFAQMGNLTAPTICICSQRRSTATTDSTIRRTRCGGATPTSTLHTRSQTARTATGRAATAGLWWPWRVCLSCFPRMRATARNTRQCSCRCARR